MGKQRCIFVYGQSIFFQAIVAGLQSYPNIEPRDFDPHHPLAGALLRQTRPSLLIIEVGGNENWLMSDLLAADTPILVVNIECGHSKLLTGKPLPLAKHDEHGIGDLVAIVNQIEAVHAVERRGPADAR